MATQNTAALNDVLVGQGDFELLEGIIASQIEGDFDTQYGLLPPEQTVVVRAYSDDSDDRILAELQPKFIVMFEPNLEFVRRIEVWLLFGCYSSERRSHYRCTKIHILALPSECTS